MSKKIHSVEDLIKKYPGATLIHNWDELKAFPNESKTHTLSIKEYSGWLYSKNRREYNVKKSYHSQLINLDHYLSTHTFYGKGMYAYSTKLLQLCGFNVIIDNWDAATEEEERKKSKLKEFIIPEIDEAV